MAVALPQQYGGIDFASLTKVAIFKYFFGETPYSIEHCTLEFLVILADCGPGGFQHPVGLLIHIPKGFSSKMTLEVAPRGLDIDTVKV